MMMHGWMDMSTEKHKLGSHRGKRKGTPSMQSSASTPVLSLAATNRSLSSSTPTPMPSTPYNTQEVTQNRF
jgi:hypothetical protein